MHPRIPLAIRSLLGRPAPFVVAVALAAVPAVAAAQEPTTEEALLEQDPAEAAGLEEARPVEKVEAGDPDPKLLQQVNERRAEFEKRLNGMQSAQPRFVKLDGQIEKLTGDFIKAQDTFLQKQADLVGKYTSAVASADEKGQRKVGDDLAKVRKGFLGEIDKLVKRADKLQAEREKLLAKYQKEQAEDAEKAEEGGD